MSTVSRPCLVLMKISQYPEGAKMCKVQLEEGGLKSAEILNKVVCKFFKITKESEKDLLKAAVFSCPNYIDSITLTRKNGEILEILIENGEGIPPARQSKIKPDFNLDKVVVNLQAREGRDVLDITYDVNQTQAETQTNAVIAFFNCKSFREMTQYGTQNGFCRVISRVSSRL